MKPIRPWHRSGGCLIAIAAAVWCNSFTSNVGQALPPANHEAPQILLSGQSHGTAGVAIWTANQALLAIDSRVTLSGGAISRAGDDTCKIHSAGRFYFAISGLYNHAATHFDAWSLAAASIATADSVPAAAQAAEHRLAPALRVALADIRRTDPEGYQHFAQAHLAIWIAGIDDGRPVLSGREFLPGRIIPHEFPPAEGAAPNAIGFSVFGERLAIDKSYPDVPSVGHLIASEGPSAAAHTLVQLEISGEPERVGPPIAILELTPGGVRWIEHGVCR